MYEDVRIAGTERLELQHLYRAMDCREAEKAAIERAIDFRVADLLSLDVDLLFTTRRACYSRGR